MKLSVILAVFLSSVISCAVCSDSELFQKITSYRTDHGNVKKVLMSKFNKDNRLNAFMFCQKYDMELLRIESYEELSRIKRALKIHWLDFDDWLHIDGTRLVDKKWGTIETWEFLSNGKIMDSSVINDIAIIKNSNYRSENCLTIGKHKLQPKILRSNCLKLSSDFLCQKVGETVDENIESDVSQPIVVDVRSRFFETVSDYYLEYAEKSTFLISRPNFKLSRIMASSFCKYFSSKLVDVNNLFQLNQLSSLIATKDRDSEFFTIGNAADNIIKVSPQGTYRRCLALTRDPTDVKSGKVFYYKCEGERESYICEADSSNSRTIPTKTSGMKLLGTFEKSKVQNLSTQKFKIILNFYFRPHSNELLHQQCRYRFIVV